ncbi:hypothetical protein [Brachyspira pilosicoli]|nr:hypothetical protein [Brachyspira pilosicoli]
MSNYYHIYKSTNVIPRNIRHKFLANEFPICSTNENLRILKDCPVLYDYNYISIDNNHNTNYSNSALDILNSDYICPECLNKLKME